MSEHPVTPNVEASGVSEADIDCLVREVMAIERTFGHVARNVQGDRKDRIREAIEVIAGRNA